MVFDPFSIFDRFSKDHTGITLSLLVLLIIKDKKRIWGYDIKQQLTQLTNNNLEINNSTIYTILKSFESKYHLLHSVMEERRRYYMLTEKGIKDMEIILKDWKNMTKLTLSSLQHFGIKINDIFKDEL